MTSPAQSILDLVEPVVTAAGFELWDVETVAGAVRVFVERPGGVDLESLGPLSHAISEVLDGRDDLAPGDRYQLEVSSPGVERTLRTPAQFQRFVGSLVGLKTTEAIDGARRFQGVLLAADQSGVVVRSEPGSGTNDRREHQISYRAIQKARTVLAWGPPSKPGRAAPPVPSTTARPRLQPASATRSGAGEPARSSDPAASMKDSAQ